MLFSLNTDSLKLFLDFFSMEFNDIIGTFPHIAKKIFQDLTLENLEICLKVSQTWCSYLEKEKFYWAKMTKGHPGWDEILKLESDLVFKLGKSFLKLKNEPEQRKSDKIVIHPIFCAIHLDNLNIFTYLTSIWTNWETLRYPYVFGPKILPFHFAAKWGSLKIIKYFVEINEDKNPKDTMNGPMAPTSMTPLHFAVMACQLETIQFLFDNIQGRETK